ncbi:MAG: ABC transporter permease [Gammaproteobacteria bacterium]|nr:ABC transporter permease [Gammaproteobacteria bacterium]
MQLSLISQIRKELTLFFTSAVGYLFLGAFLVASLFIFFWVEAFFARNIADVRPLFEWFPILLIFFTATITMRMWSEERRSGTLEFVVTVPVSTWEFVIGKFLACWSLLAIALLLTLPLPITVAVIGDLDWGPVFAGYVASLLLGGAYIAIGLFVSARTDSQIVSLIVTSLLCGIFYLLGSGTITDLFGGWQQDLLSAIGSGARFESITRGVLDVRDLYFYLSILGSFLAMNVFALEKERWAADGNKKLHDRWRLGTGLLVLNFLLGNVWLNNVSVLRFDMTEGRIYSISDATRGYLNQLQEPLLIRGYFSAKTHPLLAPLVPRMKDLLKEYEIAGGGHVRVEIIDPASAPELEDEANTKYGIRAVPFQIADRYQASLVNSYFDILVLYGDQYEVLSFRDLIEVKAQGETDIDVQLKNPEFDVTRSIKKVLYGFQGGSSVFDNIVEPVEFVGYVSNDEFLPEPLVEFKQIVNEVLAELALEGGDKFSSDLADPNAGDGQIALDIAAQYGFQPMATSLFDEARFYFYLTLRGADTVVQIPIPPSLSADGLRRGIDEGLKRFASGLLKSVVLSAPPVVPVYMRQQGTTPSNEFTQLQSFLTSDFDVITDDLKSGVVPSKADLLVVVDPIELDHLQVFAIDQFLMKGGTVVVSTAAFVTQPVEGRLEASVRTSGLVDWLKHQGVELGRSLVMDPQNSAFPVPITREVGGFSFQDLVMLDYPYFIDVRGEGLNEDSPINTGIPQITFSWASPVGVAEREGIVVTPLLRSSPDSWLSEETNIMPRYSEDGVSAFSPVGEQGSHNLGVALEGRFESYYTGKVSPLLTAEQDKNDANSDAEAGSSKDDTLSLGVLSSVIGRSPEAARLLVFGSNDFLADETMRMLGSADGTVYGNSVQMLTNVVDWALEDQNLIGIRSRGNFNRTLPGMEVSEQSMLEYLNYALALLGVFVVMFVFRARVRSRTRYQREWLAHATGEQT